MLAIGGNMQTKIVSNVLDLHSLTALPFSIATYCKFLKFRVVFISRIFHFRLIREFLNSRPFD